MTPSPTEIMTGLITVLGAVAVSIQAFRSGHSKSQEERISGLKEQLSTQGSMFKEQMEAQSTAFKEQIQQYKESRELEHKEFLAYRERTHTAANDTNVSMLKLTEENAELKAKTDLAPMYEFNKQHSRAMEAIMETLKTQGEAIQTIMRRLDGRPA